MSTLTHYSSELLLPVYVFGSGGVGGEDWVWALLILWEQGKCWTCVCVLVVVVWVGSGLGPRSGRVGWCYVCVSCESGFSV